METRHRIYTGDARSLDRVADDSVELVVTSPPYPMIEMWDEPFTDLDPEIGAALEAGEGARAFDLMHAVLDAVWAEVERVLVDGGIACVNVGDATRSVDGTFRVYQNHSRIIEAFDALGFDPLPEILWRKPVNSAAKFMGSGMVPPNAYVTLEHEYVLVFRNGSESQSFEPGADRRYEAAYFWEERNDWFSDVWTDLTGKRQPLEDETLRDRSAAFPFAIPYRLINMYSVYGDTVLDPFWGTGTTSVAAMVAGRNSIGAEIDPAFVGAFEDRVTEVPDLSRDVIAERLEAHRAFLTDARADGEDFAYEAEHYGFSVRTKQERGLRLYAATGVEAIEDGYRVQHSPVESIPKERAERESEPADQ